MRAQRDRVTFLNVDFDRITLAAALDILQTIDVADRFSYVVTPNVDHLVRLDRSNSPGLFTCYRDAALCLCDSRILAMLGRLRGVSLATVPGSDLTKALLESSATRSDRVLVVGGNEEGFQRLQRRFPLLDMKWHDAPMGLSRNAFSRTRVANAVATDTSRYKLLALGSPQQEMIAAEVAAIAGATGVGLCIGASLDFMTGAERRAPVFMQRVGLEWLFRLLRNPRRLARRYLIDGPHVFLMTTRWRR